MEDFVSYDIAVKLKEKGFKEKCIAYYWENINEHTPSFVVEDNMPDEGICIIDLLSEHNKAEWSPFIDAPTISQVLKWLREVKGVHIDIAIWKSKYIAMIVFIDKPDQNIEHYNETIWEDERLFDTYEQAVIAGIEYVLNNLI